MELDARLTVLGSLNMDISVTVGALPGPGETVLGGAASFAPGGKGANQAVAAARLGAPSGLRVRMVGCVGDDDFGRALRAALVAEEVDDQSVRAVPGAPTGIAMITVDRAGENTIVVAPGANREVGPAEIAAISNPPGSDARAAPAGHARPAVHTRPAADGPHAGPAATADALARPGHVLVISAEVPVAAIEAALAAAGGEGRAGGEERPLIVLNLAPSPPEAARIVAAHPDWLVVNESEAAAVLGRPVSGLDAAAAAAAGLVAAGARHAVVTAGAAGAAYHGAADRGAADQGAADQGAAEYREASETVPAFSVTAIDTVGAGDTFVGALAVTLAAGIPPHEAVRAASAAAATAAARAGTQVGMPRPADVRAVTGYQWPL